MRRALPSAFLLAALTITSTACLNAQNDRFAYAITDLTKDGAGWNVLRKLDLSNGQYSDVLLNGTDAKLAVYDASSKKQLTLQADARYGNLLQTPFSTGVAAAAYDKAHNRLYFTPMFADQLRYVDLKTMQVYFITGQPFSGAGDMHNDEAKVITRMVIAPDGNGYAINNDGTTFIRFSTGKKPKIEQLGTLVDDPANNGISIHNRCSSFGGDMIADNEGNFYILSARNNVFKVNVENKVAKFLGTIKDLPANFTVNGAVVDADGNLLVSSAIESKAYFVVNPKDWTATAYTGATSVFRSSDLANSNFLSSARKQNPEIATITRAEEKFSKLIAVYPNPVTSNRISVQFNKVPQGDYTVELTDVIGRSVMQRKISINNEVQIQPLSLSEGAAKGVYMVKVYDTEKQSVFTQKVVVQ
ncbi:MAG: T9SS type A sorting domain-containing protein [Chitinophagaceae bacterium]|nr:MAG: T9SS type A sorting domain-containing protein [Chitinophagaceae bacterium]